MRNPDLIENLYTQHYKQLFVFGLLFENEPPLVKDAINDVFLDLCEKPAYIAGVRSPLAYLSICVKNKLLKFKKRTTMHVSFSTFEVDPEVMTDEHVEEIEEQHQLLCQRIERAIDKLTTRQRELIQLKYFLEKDTTEIVSITGMSTKTVYNTLSSALKNIRTEIKHGLWIVIVYLFAS